MFLGYRFGITIWFTAFFSKQLLSFRRVGLGLDNKSFINCNDMQNLRMIVIICDAVGCLQQGGLF